MHNANKGMSTQQVVLILGAFVVVAAAAVSLILFMNNDEEPAQAALAPAEVGEVITPENIERIGSEVQQSVDKGMFLTHYTNVWAFTDGESASYDAIMGNASGNTYPFWFNVTLRDTGEEVFKSGLIPVGSQISEIKLSRDLEAGSYDATITVHLMEEDGATPIEGNMGFGVTLNIES